MMSSEDLSAVAEEIVGATKRLPRNEFGNALDRFTHVLCDREKAYVVAGHINTLIGAPPERQQELAQTLWQHARDDLEVTVAAAEVDLAGAAMLRAIEQAEGRDNDLPGNRGNND
ncbi:Uncharacterised protein [Mycobacteroides abscessus subsp. abscessus]|uniref:hypothetical protein n=2 Tax=Mycobacteroides abscessus TaxID=36809 RepID=UPI00092CE07E|nr:hypothetical protein [Mycobacteroides abscessus]SIC59047.1 Uncharacterised protein [Mycobacteroides abscessus subsp. abscessus]SIC90491.1 Uncharacterised protein [Mycobacteroides abscessus subsp. abscessus]SID10500.1 Uncharacterised protein [Mycobacteroides abscessus subsp. abscessus]SID18490.1 Uncharacterised protein [Mycobacteroides abscessus subsp. abscessus]SKT53289.1 Uncharacterised protein [Mycobacteroides abscessus subsp. abscessus]